MINFQTSTATKAPAKDSQLSELGLNIEPEVKEKDDKNQFLELMIAQLENQNPLDPQKGGEFLAQLAQFSMVDGIERLNASTDTMQQSYRTSQALEAANLVGRSVSVATGRFHKGVDEVSGSVQVPNSSSGVRIEITNNAGEVVRSFSLGEQAKGNAAFVWDGMDNAGLPMAKGSYQVSAFAKTNDGEEQLTTEIDMNVDSVTLAQAGKVELNVAGYGVLSLDDVREIR